MDFKVQMSAYLSAVESGIHRLLPAAQTPPSLLHTAMRYSLEAGGKRLRPVLVLAAAESLSKASSTVPDPIPAAIAVECLHTYSLIHDDLPAMDNSDLRRGRPTCHIRFDEATAILAGDALLTCAFEILGRHYAGSPALGIALVHDLSAAAGSQGMIGGQMEDILTERSRRWDESQLDYIHRHKTAALIACCTTMGARLAGGDTDVVALARRFGLETGYAFQLIDDVLDVSSQTAELGKPAGLDIVNQTATAVSLYGVEGARQKAAFRTRQALEACRQLPGDTAFLQNLVQEMESRIR